MTTPEWLKPGLQGAVVGAITISILGFTWGGWMTGGGATKMAKSTADEQVLAALVPVCLEQSRVDPARAAKLVTIKAATRFNRHKEIMTAGWATTPGDDKPNSDLAKACIDGLELDAT